MWQHKILHFSVYNEEVMCSPGVALKCSLAGSCGQSKNIMRVRVNMVKQFMMKVKLAEVSVDGLSEPVGQHGEDVVHSL